jgi:hypothetical protein
MALLPLRKMTLYKHGVGHFVREGTFDSHQLTMTFRRDDINDVLKSLVVFDRAEGQVLGIDYETPLDRKTRLSNNAFDISNRGSQWDLIRDARGRQVRLALESDEPGKLHQIVGRVIGLDDNGRKQIEERPRLTPPERVSNSPLIVLLDEEGDVHFFPLEKLLSLYILESNLRQDLNYFLDTSMSEETQCAVTVRLTEGQHDLFLSYVAPSPVWRVSYRLVAAEGKAYLQGWGLFDNNLDEDLENVTVTLVAGQPISFIYDLYSTYIPERAMVEDEARISPGAIDYRLARGAQAELSFMTQEAEAADFAAPAPRAKARAITMMASAAPPAAADFGSQEASAEGHEAGAFFEYQITTPVTVKRGGSALFPILNSEVQYEQELLYNGQKFPTHPVIALRFTNNTGLTLERGPVTVMENADYKGEAVIPFTQNDGEVYVPHAVELGVRVTEQPDAYIETAGLQITGTYLIYEEFTVRSVTYILENDTAKPLSVLIEAPIIQSQGGVPLKRSGNRSTGKFELFETPQPDYESATERRWRVEVPAYGRTEFTYKQRQPSRRQEELRKIDYQDLQKFMEQRWLDKATLEHLSGLLETLGKIQKAVEDLQALKIQRNELYQKQEQVRANLVAFKESDAENPLSARIWGQMEALQDRLDENDKKSDNLNQEIERLEKEVTQQVWGVRVQAQDDLTQERIRAYQFQERITQNEQGSVYRALQPATGREVAIKIIRPAYADQDDFVERFETEARAVSQLEHPNILPLFDFWREANGGAYLVMQLSQIRSLREWLKQGAMALPDVILIIEQIASALDHAHRKGVTHRDIRPDNILLDEQGQISVTNFVIAKTPPIEDPLTGSNAYMAPELWQGKTASAQSDIYALGIVLYELIIGMHPFAGSGTTAFKQKHLKEPLPTIKAAHPVNYGEDEHEHPVNKVIQKATAKNPGDRYPDGASLVKSLKDLDHLVNQETPPPM